MKKKHFRFLSLAFFLIGIFFLLNSKTDITGAVVGVSNISSGFSSIFGIVFLIGSVVMFVGGENLEERVVDIYETKRGKIRFVEAKGLDDIAPFIQLDTRETIDNQHINLKDLKELLDDTTDEKGRKEISKKYEHSIKEKIYGEFKDYFEYKLKHKDKESRERRDEIAKGLREARSAESLFQLLDPNYKTRRERLNNIKKSNKNNPHIYNPIKEGKAVYVRYTTDNEIKCIEDEGVIAGEKESQSLYFPSLEKAEDFINKTSSAHVKQITGAKKADKAIVFQTIYAPDKINYLVGEKSKGMPKAFFTNLKKDSCYLFKVMNPPK